MSQKSSVEIADNYSRKRAWFAGAAAVVLMVNIFLQLWLTDAGTPLTRTRVDWWAINAGAMLLILATGGGLLLRPGVRALMNDEVAKRHFATGMVFGFWVAMLAGMAIYLAAPFREMQTRLALRIVISTSVSVALLTFAALEIRAHRDG